MDLNSNKELEKLIHQIYNEILLEANVNPSGIVWETIISTEGKGVIEKGINHSISNGGVGITLFLIEYYKIYPNEELKEIVIKSLNSSCLYYQKNQNEVGFYNGRGGLLYALANAYKTFNDERFLLMTKEIIVIPLPDLAEITYNLYSGIAGLILGMMHSITFVKEESILPRIKELVEVLISGVKIKKEGVYWDELYFTSQSLCSFLYGNSGIIFLLKELKKVFETSSFNKIIDEAICLEDQFYNKKNKNWADFFNEREYLKVNSENVRKLIDSPKKYPIEPANTFSWYMGSPGTLLARMDKMSEVDEYHNSYKGALHYLAKSAQHSSANYALYNGLGGVMLTLMTMDFITHTEAGNYCRELIEQSKKYNHLLTGHPYNSDVADLSLLQGESGVAYLLLKVLYPAKFSEHVLFPSITMAGGIMYDKKIFAEINKIPIKNILPEIDHAFWNERIDTNTYYEIAITSINTYTSLNRLTCEELLRFEKFKLLQKDINYLREYIKFLYFNSSPDSIDDKYKSFALSDSCKIIQYEDTKYLLVRKIGKVESQELTMWDDLFFSFFEGGKTLKNKDLLNKNLEAVNVETAEDIEFVTQETNKKIEFGVKNGILIAKN